MRMRKMLVSALLAATVLVSATAIAQGCLQGTWHYYDAAGRLVGEQTVGCGESDGTWGVVTSRSTFTQGCVSSF